MSKTNFNDIFNGTDNLIKSDAGETLVDCPHCEVPITKSDLEKSDIAKQNASGKTMRGGSGKGQVESKRSAPGVKKHDDPAGIQNSKGSRTRKGGSDDSASDDGSDDASDDKPPMKKSMMTVRGTEVCQYFDFGDAPGSDASIAKSIMEAQGQLGQSVTQPMDLNNDLSRLLV
jgi:hypothetical protein